MSLQELEKKVRHLDESELVRFSVWFDRYRETRGAPAETRDAGQLSKTQRAELDRRLDALDADPALAVPWEGTIEKVNRRLEKLRAQKTARR